MILSFEYVKEKAEKLREIVIEFEKKIYDTWWDNLGEKYDVLRDYEFAPLIATICDWKIDASDAWSIPWWILKNVGSLDPDKILSADIKKILKSYFDSKQGKFPPYMKSKDRDNWLRKTSEYLKESLMYFKNENTTPVKMFENREYDVIEVYFMLRKISGIGSKKASMIVRDFIHRTKNLVKRHPWFDQIKKRNPKFAVVGEDKTIVPIDVHAVKVFNRIFGRKYGNWRREQEQHWWDLDIQLFSRLVFPEYPARLDLLLWYIGNRFCNSNWKNANCNECYLRQICNSSKY